MKHRDFKDYFLYSGWIKQVSLWLIYLYLSQTRKKNSTLIQVLLIRSFRKIKYYIYDNKTSTI